MSEKLTRIRLRDAKFNLGLMDWGEHSYEDMVKQIKDNARRQLAEAQEVLAADDFAFDVDIVRGSIVQHHVRDVAPADKAEAAE